MLFDRRPTESLQERGMVRNSMSYWFLQEIVFVLDPLLGYLLPQRSPSTAGGTCTLMGLMASCIACGTSSLRN